MKEMIQKFIRDEDGASAVEYALLVAVVAVTLSAGIITFYNSLAKKMAENAELLSKGEK